ncbi:hypothetical protein R83H12_01655 [Fibrobacteria bacterium R8-3-H12]
MSTEELIAEIETLPKECIPQVRDLIVFLRRKPVLKGRAWAFENSLMKCKPLHLGKRSWTRDELYER